MHLCEHNTICPVAKTNFSPCKQTKSCVPTEGNGSVRWKKTPIPSMAERTIPFPLEATHGDNESKKRKRICWLGNWELENNQIQKVKFRQTNNEWISTIKNWDFCNAGKITINRCVRPPVTRETQTSITFLWKLCSQIETQFKLSLIRMMAPTKKILTN